MGWGQRELGPGRGDDPMEVQESPRAGGFTALQMRHTLRINCDDTSIDRKHVPFPTAMYISAIPNILDRDVDSFSRTHLVFYFSSCTSSSVIFHKVAKNTKQSAAYTSCPEALVTQLF